MPRRSGRFVEQRSGAAAEHLARDFAVCRGVVPSSEPGIRVSPLSLFLS